LIFFLNALNVEFMQPQLSPQILFEDTHLTVLVKPAGLLSQGDISGEPNLVDWLRGHFGRNYVGLIHRLDRNTSGILVVAKRTKSAERLTKALQEGNLTREYRAWLVGELAQTKQTWRHFLLKDEKKNESRVVPAQSFGAKEAVLHLEVLEKEQWKGKAVTLAAIRLETGRSHQIRVQAAASGHPLLGDPKYGDFFRESWNTAFGRPALHSFSLSFPHPMSGEWMKFEAPLPDDMRKVQS
jgi:23S rRNA pseudouridine1911/1915/1917 synthase